MGHIGSSIKPQSARQQSLDKGATPADARFFVVTNRSVLAIAVPMTLAYLTTPLLGIVDTAVVGQFGDAALLGGLAAGALVFDLVFTTFNFLRSGTTGLVAQAFGRGDALEEQAVFWRALLIAVVAGIVLAGFAPLFAVGGQWFMGAEPRVSEAMSVYIHIRLLAAPFSLINFAILGYVLGRGEGGLGLMLQAVLNGINILLCFLLGLELGWGVAGVAWATVTGEFLAMLLGLAIVLRRFSRLERPSRRRILDVAAYKHMLSLNRDIMIRSFSLLAAFALFTRQGAQFGTVTLAANAVLMNFFLIAGYFLDGFATAAEQLAGRAIGAQAQTPFRRAVQLTLIWGFGLAALATLVLLAAGTNLIALVTTSAEVRAVADTYLPWAAFTALSGVLAFQMDGVFIGATWSRDMRNMMLLSFLVFAAALITLAPAFGNHGLWATLHVFLLVRGFSLLAILQTRMRTAFS
ncbi:MAG: MATE family efflux transporter [Mesorhizobium sp.]|nr:MATE family efflux transporter [bacterium M00.F.Ca.ET.205.01.1.1]TGU48311.1 MATE family efflux transporter [bacterium M00.F.Ca.ET.152.01.1.1]TGV32571.1 MATE family efflux transporter [Mesorhizobium sp. M00.F.Ca.ET.186.01.1.1]TGZ39828.1 MATE family efflux transporter [bacterium M00.F.Ca.ET.162.01.1.1]TIW60500.1 MAG: MATE family efflux transporter [Mesorhizobium sp.]